MSNKKFIGGGFPGIKECIDEKNVLTKESREKREFSVRKLIPINQILSKQTKNLNQFDELFMYNQQNYEQMSEDLSIIENIKYNPIQNFLHNSYAGDIKINKSFDLSLINNPIKASSVKKGSVKKGSVKKGSVKKGSVKKGSVKKGSVKKQNK
jgi:hypothetical protein